MIFTPENLQFRIAVPQREWREFRDELGPSGYRTHALSLSGSTSDPRYTGVLVKRAQAFRGTSFLAEDESGLREQVARIAQNDGLHPYVIAATGSATHPVYAAAFRELGEKPVVEPNMTAGEFANANAKQHDANRILLWFDCFGSSSDIRYCAIWGANRNRVAWSADGMNDDPALHQQRFDAMTSVWARQALAAVTPTGGLASLYVDSRIASWAGRPAMTRRALGKEIASQALDGRYPVCIGAASVGATTLFSPVFANSDSIHARTWRVRGPAPVVTVGEQRTKADRIDAAMQTFVQSINVRGAALAIVQGTRLVYAKGFTFAEGDYPDVQPTTLFRQASVAKLFCAVAMWRLMAQDAALSRRTTLQSVLHLRTPDGLPPKDSEFAKITLRHLLESNSGIDQASVGNVMFGRRDETDKNQPMTADEVASAIAALDMPGIPGDAGKAVYGKTDYFLLSRVISKLRGLTDFDAALHQVLLHPLQMARTRGSRSLTISQAGDEARYHLGAHLRDEHGEIESTHLSVGSSVMHMDRRLLPKQYGSSHHEIYDGAGGISSAVIDVARLCAALGCRINNPIFSSSMLNEFLRDAVNATLANPKVAGHSERHGFHGFDAATFVGSDPNSAIFGPVAYSKGGGLSGIRTAVSGVTGGRVYVMAYNGDMGPGVFKQWNDVVGPFADVVDFGSGDLFPFYDMPSLGRLPESERKLTPTQYALPDFPERTTF